MTSITARDRLTKLEVVVKKVIGNRETVFGIQTKVF